jgi:uncharacterized membrane protein
MAQQPSAGTGLPSNVAGAIAYLLGPFTGVGLLLIEKEDAFVRFHAAQSVIVGVALIVIAVAYSLATAVFALIPVAGWLIGLLIGIALAGGAFALWILLMLRAFQGRLWTVPFLGFYARRMLLRRGE